MSPRPNQRTIFSGGTVLTMDPAQPNLLKGDVLVIGETIAAIGEELPHDDAEVIDCTGKIVVPGFIDTHRHTWQTNLRMIGTDWLLSEYMRMVRVLGAHYRPDDLRLSNLMGGLDSINSGVTTFLDWSHLMSGPDHSDAAVEGLVQSGCRAVLGYGNSNDGWTLPNDILWDEDDARRVRDTHFSSGDGIVTMAAAVRGPDFGSVELAIDDFAAARRLELPITVHVGCNGTVHHSVKKLADAGLLGDDVTHVHCNTSTPEELDLIKESGGLVSIAPEAEMHLGCGLPPTGDVIAHGLRPSISSDVPSVLGVDMFGQMRSLLTIQRGTEGHRAIYEEGYTRPPSITSHDVLEFATIEGARATHLDGLVGSLTPGKKADITVVSTAAQHMWPTNNPSAALVMGGNPRDVETVMVNGEIRKRDGQLVGVDYARIKLESENSRDYLFAKAGLKLEDFIA